MYYYYLINDIISINGSNIIILIEIIINISSISINSLYATTGSLYQYVY